MTLGTVGLFGLAGVLGGGFVLWLIAALPAPIRQLRKPQTGVSIYLFRDDDLLDHSGGASGASDVDFDTWPELRDQILDRFGDLPETLRDVDGPTIYTSYDGGQDQLSIRPAGTSVEVTLDDQTCAPPHDIAPHDIAMNAPYPIWRMDRNHRVVWKNAACNAGFDALLTAPENTCPEGASVRQIKIEHDAPDTPTWYEISARRQGNECVCYASDITETIKAQEARRAFVQTLTKTFANLTTGLAVFDHNRKLVIFNPALVDLTALPVEFLSTTPDLMSVFDRLRNKQIMPEPRDYGGWRSRIDQILSSAQCGLYEETWALPSNVTFRVTGRPHPDGAVAFLFEDISADVMLSRRHHLELEKRDAIFDRLQDAVVVLGRDDVVTLCNRPFRTLFGLDPDQHPSEIRLDAVLRRGDEVFPHDPAFWRNCREVARLGETPGAQRLLSTSNGAMALSARLERLPGGDRMLVFCQAETAVPALPALV